jgi:FkbM family methyltransferase
MTPNTRSITLNGRTMHVTGEHSDFWDRFASNTWEPETLEVFDHYIGADTLYLDVGCWIGPTLLYAAARAKLAVGFEPDPAAFATLEGNVAANPSLTNIRIHRIAIAAARGELRIGSQGTKGDSMSSALFSGSQESWSAQARRLDDLEADWPSSGNCFVKMDVEGGEYDTLPSMATFLHSRRATLFLSFHQRFFLQPYQGKGFLQKLRGECRLFAKVLRFWPLLRRYPYIYDEYGRRVSAVGFLKRKYWRRTDTLLLSYSPGPWTKP